MAGGGDQTIGYTYFMTLQSGLCRGPIDELVEIRAGERTAWSGSATETTSIRIDAPELFGGKKREGGIQGVLQLFMGKPDQVYTPPENFGAWEDPAPGPVPWPIFSPGVAFSKFKVDFETVLGEMIPAFRGVVTCVFDGMISQMNPYPKAWKFRMRRAQKGWFNDDPWYPARARIYMAEGKVHAMNPAHIIYECYTNPEWGAGVDPAEIDENSFIYAANVLCDEGFGLCMLWNRREDINDFINVVIDHIGGARYVDRETGKITLRLLRDDYDPEEIPLFTPTSGLLAVEDDTAAAPDTGANEIIVKWHNPITDEDGEARWQNLAAFQATGAVVSKTVDYSGIPTADLALRVAQRDGRVSTGLRRLKLRLDRRGWRITPGSVFRISYPARGIENMIVRAGVVDDGNMTSGELIVPVVEDVFGLAATAYIDPEPGTYVPPDYTPVPLPAYKVFETPYIELARNLSAADLDAVTIDQGFVAALGAQPNSVSLNYELWARVGDEEDPYVFKITGDWAATALLVDPLGPYDTDIVFNNARGLDNEVGAALMIGDEIVKLVALDIDAGTASVERGCADTVPVAHAAGERLWFFEGEVAGALTVYAESEEVDVKLLTRTSGGLLAQESAATDTVDIAVRQARPYPPGDVTVDGEPALTLETTFPGEFTIAWTQRNRITQSDTLIGHEAADVAHEAGTTYTLRFYDNTTDTLLRTEDGLTTSPFTYDSSMATADGDPNHIRIELESVREELTSWQRYSFYVNRPSGWGFTWGEDWGGT